MKFDPSSGPRAVRIHPGLLSLRGLRSACRLCLSGAAAILAAMPLLVPRNAGAVPLALDEPGLTIESGTSVLKLAEGDFDADGKRDLATVESISPPSGSFAVRIRFGLGDGRFGPATFVTGAAQGTVVGVGRMDGDTMDDVVIGGRPCATCSNGSVEIWLGRADRALVPADSPVLIERPVRAMAVGNVDTDLDDDVVVSFADGASTNDYAVLSNDGSGSMTQKPARLGFPADDLAIADLTGDGQADLAALFYLWVSVRPGSGQGVFDSSGFALGTPNRLGSISVGRVDSDWDLEIVGSRSMEPGLTVFRNDGDAFTAMPVVPTSGIAGRVVIGDLDADGKPDLLAPIAEDNEVAVFHGNGDATFTPAYVRPTGHRPSQVVVLDADPDGFPDIVAGSQSELSLVVHRGRPDGPIGSPGIPTGASPSAIALGDFDADGQGDFVVANRNSHSVSLFRTEGAGGVWARTELPVQSFPSGVGLADLDADGFLDLLTVHAAAARLEVRRGLGPGGFEPPVCYDIGAQPRGLRVSDLDRDGRLDVLVACDNSSAALTILYAQSGGELGNRTDYPPPVAPATLSDFHARDITGDGRIDVLVATERGGQIVIYPGTAEGALATPYLVPASEWVTGVDFVDAEGDGVLDLVATRPNEGDVIFLKGLGGGAFSPPVSTPVGVSPQSVRAGDLDGDRIPDLVVSGAGRTTPVSAGNVQVLRGVGDGTFVAEPGILVGSAPGALALGEVTLDDRVEILVASPPSGSVHVLVNHSENGSVDVRPGPVAGGLSCRVTPNPSRGTVRLAIATSQAGSARIELHDVTGRRILSRTVEIAGESVIALTPESEERLTPGLYVVRIQQGGRRATTRAVILP